MNKKLNIGPGPWTITWERGASRTFCPRGTINDAAGHFTGITVDSLSDAYLHDGGELDARRTAHGYVATAAPELLAALEDALKTALFEKHPYRPWHADAARAIVHAKGWSAIAEIEKTDPQGVHAGHYFIDSPSED